jgi:hypothetical protein
LPRKLALARKQARRYAGGALGGCELSKTRYIVVVSRDIATLPADVEQDNVSYRHVGIQVAPKAPSKTAGK